MPGYIDAMSLQTKAGEKANAEYAKQLRTEAPSTEIKGFSTDLKFAGEVVTASWNEAADYTGSADNVNEVTSLTLSAQTRTFPSDIKVGSQVTVDYTLNAKLATEIKFTGEVTHVSPNYITITGEEPASGKILGDSTMFVAKGK